VTWPDVTQRVVLGPAFAVEATEVYDPFQDEEPLECGLEDPEACESCQ
jgi:hypothetical protein